MGRKKENRIDDIISITAFADMMKCTEAAVRKAIKSNKIVESVHRHESSGRVSGIDWKLAKKEWAAVYTPGVNKSSGVLDALEEEGLLDGIDAGQIRAVSESKKLQEHYKAELARIELEEKEKILVSASKVRKDLYNFGMEVRVALQGVPDACVDDVMVASGRREAKSEIRKAIDFALNKLTEVIERDFG